MEPVDVLVVPALPVEFEQARAAGSASPPVGFARPAPDERPHDGSGHRGARRAVAAVLSGDVRGVPGIRPLLGDVVVAEIACAYDEGQRTADGLVADHRQLSLPPGTWTHRLAALEEAAGRCHLGPDRRNGRAYRRRAGHEG